jgi:hypothetical protein
MKKIYSFLVVLAIAVGFASCSQNSPKATAQRFLDALYQKDYDGAKKYATEETKKQLDAARQMNATVTEADKQAKVEILDENVKVQGDTAFIGYTVTGPEDSPTGLQTLQMVKVEGKWLAQWSKMGELNDMLRDAQDMEMPASPNMSGDSASMMAPPTDMVPAEDDTAVLQ